MKYLLIFVIGLIVGAVPTRYVDLHPPVEKVEVPVMPSNSEPQLVKLELSIGGEVEYYKLTTDHTIHIIADENGNGAKLQIIPDNYSADDSPIVDNGKPANTSITQTQ